MESEKNFNPKPEKPSVLFHASSHKDIDVIEPRAEKTRDPGEGPKVFGTPSRAMVSMFLVPSDDTWVQSGAINNLPYIIISDEARYRSLDKGGVIYHLPSDTFSNDSEVGSKDLEWTSATGVEPVGKEFVSSALGDMYTQGVQIYFVDKETYQSIQNAPDNGVSIVDVLTPFTGD